MSADRDWFEVVERLIGGDRLALLELTNLATGFLARLRAYDFRDDWDDLVQESILATAVAVRDGRLNDRGAAYGYLRNTVRFQFNRRLRSHFRRSEDDTLPWDDASAPLLAGDASQRLAAAARGDLSESLAGLPQKTRDAVVAVYVEGRTYEEAVERTGIPLGSLKRYLRDGLAQLREEIANSSGSRDPIRVAAGTKPGES